MKFHRLYLLIATALPLAAHDYWFTPKPAAPKPGETVALHLHVGHHLVSEQERKLQLAKTPSFRVHGPDGVTDLLSDAKEDNVPAGRFTPAKSGAYMITMHRGASDISLEPKIFEYYLKDEGLEHIVLEREKKDETEKPGRERYDRSIKAYVTAGAVAPGDDTYRRKFGLQLEIVPEKDPAALRPGERLPVTVYFDGQPLAEAAVFLLHRDARLRGNQRATTDAQGRAEFIVYAPGEWLIRLVHMRRAPPADKDVEWLSTWGAYSFTLN